MAKLTAMARGGMARDQVRVKPGVSAGACGGTRWPWKLF
jgi:hypothetical protein